MPRSLAFLLALVGCVPSDFNFGPCGPDGEGCVSEGLSIDIRNPFVGLNPESEVVLARGGIVELFVNDGGAGVFDLRFEITGGELVTQAGYRCLTVRALEDEVLVEVDIDRYGDYILFDSLPLDDVKLMPVEEQFQYGVPLPERFALVRDAFISVIIHLLAGETRLYDARLLTTGLAAGVEAYVDSFVLNGTIDPLAFTVSGSTFSTDFEIPFAGEIDSIEVVDGPELGDPREPIVVGGATLSRVCFTAMAGGLPVAGLEWRMSGDAIEGRDGCALIREGASILTVEVGGLSRVFELQIEAP